jgi:hypothetical protein
LVCSKVVRKQSDIQKTENTMKQHMLIVIFFVLTGQEIFGQGTMLPMNLLPMILGGDGPQKNGPPLIFSSPNILVDENKITGKRDTITVGSTVKLWLKSEKHRAYRQSLSKYDFNKNTFYLKAQLVSITDSTLVLMKGDKPSFMLPLPPPYSLIPLLAMKLMPLAKEQSKVRMDDHLPKPKRKLMAMMFDTIKIKEIVKFRVENMVTEGAFKSLTMMPAMSFMPKSFMVWPRTLYAMPAMMIGSEMIGNVAFSTRRVNTNESRHRVLVENAPIIKSSTPKKETSKYEMEWGYEKIDQWNRVKDKISDLLFENAISEYRGNKIMSFSFGYMMFPSYVIGPDDKRTKVNIPDKKFMFGFSMENFISEKIRIGMEMQTCQLSQSSGNFSSQNISVGMGFVMSNYTCMKIGIGNGFYSGNYKDKLKTQIEELKNDVGLNIDSNIKTRIDLIRMKLLANPKPYFMFGGGAVNTTLMKIHGSSGSMSVNEYTQKRFSLTAGVGVLTRLGWRLTYDLSCKYVYSPDYSPTIGGLYSYSGIKVQLNIGYMYGGSFSKMKQLYKQCSRDYLGSGK